MAVKNISISLEEYRKLIEVCATMKMVKHLVDSDKYMSIDNIKQILKGIESEEE